MRPRDRFLLLFLCSFLLTGSWALASPPFAAPDEPAHVYRAAAVIRGHLLPSADEELPDGRAVVQAPAGLVDSAGRIECFIFKPEVPASCAGDAGPDERLTDATTAAARYHPIYYAAVGWPTLFLSDNAAVFAMRLVSALLVSLLLAAGLQSAFEHQRSGLLLTGSFVTLTPMVVFLGGVVNPSSVEIAAAFTVWASGLTLIKSDDPARQSVLLRRLSLAAMVMVTARTISPLWLFLTLLCLLVLAGRKKIIALMALRSTPLWASLVALATIASVAWTVFAGPNPVPPESSEKTSLPTAVGLMLQVMPQRLDQYIGRFGWLDTHSPAYSLVAMTVVLGFLVLLGLVLGSRLYALVIVALTLTVFAIPVLIEAWQFNSTGYFWQMRYQQPLAFGVPMVAAAAIRWGNDPSVRARFETRIAWVVVPPVALAHLLCFVWALRRYQVGETAPIDVLYGSWVPRVGTLTVIGLQGLGLVLLAVLVLWLTKTHARTGEQDDVLLPERKAALPGR
jgi:hypothetical protein